MTHHLPIHHLVFGCRQRCDRLGQHLELAYQQAHFPAARPDQIATRLDEVTDVKMILEALHLRLAEFVDAEEELDARAAVLDMRERQLAHQPDGAQASTQHRAEHVLAAGCFVLLELMDGFGVAEVHFAAGRVGFIPFCAHLLHFFKTDSFQLVEFHWSFPFNKMSLPG